MQDAHFYHLSLSHAINFNLSLQKMQEKQPAEVKTEVKIEE